MKKRQVQFVFNIRNKKYKYNNKRGLIKKKPEIVIYYNKLKSGVDLADMAISIYHTKRKTKKWGKSIIFYLLDKHLNNLSIIYNN